MNQALSSSLAVIPLSAHIGAEIRGVDLTGSLSAAEIAGIREALLKWRVIFFREQFLNHQQHVAFSAQFGEPTVGHPVFGYVEGHPEIYSIAKFRQATRYEGAPVRRPWTGWHTDVTAAVNPPWASILRGVTIPPYGGDTQWTNLVRAYETLSPPIQRLVDGLRGIHRFTPPPGAAATRDYAEAVERRSLVSEHPLVRIHPETGERALYVSPSFLKSIVDVTPTESQGDPRTAVGTRDASRIHGALQVGAAQPGVLGQPLDRAPGALRHLRSRLRPPALPHHPGGRRAGRSGRPRLGGDRGFAGGRGERHRAELKRRPAQAAPVVRGAAPAGAGASVLAGAITGACSSISAAIQSMNTRSFALTCRFGGNAT